MLMRNSVPTLTIGGFLGAGKTTLVNQLLGQADGRRIVVFVNDFGAINIDHALIATVEEDRIALSNGCVCCSLNDDLVRSMVEFCENDRPDLFVIEASGVADPKALASTLQALQAAGQAHLQSRIYVLDAAHFGGLDYADTEDLIDHAAASDLILINKSDLVTEQRVNEIGELLERSAPGPLRKVTAQASLSWQDAIGLKNNRIVEIHSGSLHAAHTDFRAVYFENIPPLTERRLDALIDLLKETCLRAKGFLQLEDPHRFATRLQLVGRFVELTPLAAKDDLQPRLVVIGWSKTLPVNQVARLLKANP